jgi:hypothetical protein
MAFSGMLRRAALVRTDVSEELSASFIRVTRIGEVGTTLVVTSKRRTATRRNIPEDAILQERVCLNDAEEREMEHIGLLQLHASQTSIHYFRGKS